MNKLYDDSSYLPNLSSAKKRSTPFLRLILAVILVALLASMQGCSKKTMPLPTGSTADISDRGIKEFSLPGSVQAGETVFNIAEDTYTVTVKLK